MVCVFGIEFTLDAIVVRLECEIVNIVFHLSFSDIQSIRNESMIVESMRSVSFVVGNRMNDIIPATPNEMINLEMIEKSCSPIIVRANLEMFFIEVCECIWIL